MVCTQMQSAVTHSTALSGIYPLPLTASPNRGGGTCTEDQESPSPQAGRGWGGVKLCGLFRRLTTQWSAHHVQSVRDWVPTQFVSRCSLHATVRYWAALCICVHTSGEKLRFLALSRTSWFCLSLRFTVQRSAAPRPVHRAVHTKWSTHFTLRHCAAGTGK